MPGLPAALWAHSLHYLPASFAIVASVCREWRQAALQLWGQRTALSAVTDSGLLLQWARQRACFPDTAATAAVFARQGDLPSLRAVHPECRWDGRCTWAAAAAGHVHVLQWVTALGCAIGQGAFIAAVEGGHTAVLEWGLDSCHIRDEWHHGIAVDAAGEGQIKVLQWYYEQDCDFLWRSAEQLAQAAAAYGQLSALQWLQSTFEHFILTNDVVYRARRHAHVLQWIVQQPYSKVAIGAEVVAQILLDEYE